MIGPGPHVIDFMADPARPTAVEGDVAGARRCAERRTTREITAIVRPSC